MKDRTNQQKPLLEQTIASIGLMYESLQALYEDEYPKSSMWFAIMAQGPVDQMRDLLDDVDWLMEDMIPAGLREQAARLNESEELAAVATRAAA